AGAKLYGATLDLNSAQAALIAFHAQFGSFLGPNSAGQSLQAQLVSALSNFQKAANGLALAEAEFGRVQQLLNETQQSVDKVKQALTAAEQRLASLQNTLASFTSNNAQANSSVPTTSSN